MINPLPQFGRNAVTIEPWQATKAEDWLKSRVR